MSTSAYERSPLGKSSGSSYIATEMMQSLKLTYFDAQDTLKHINRQMFRYHAELVSMVSMQQSGVEVCEHCIANRRRWLQELRLTKEQLQIEFKNEFDI